MSLFVQPVTVSDLTSLQSGLTFTTNTAEATLEMGSINASPANGPGESVFTYASKLLNSNLSLSQVAMADTAIMEGGTVAIGNTTTTNTLTFLTTQFLPGQVAVAAAFGFDQTVFAAETLGLALASTTGFQTNFGSLNTSQFLQAVSTATGVATPFLVTFFNNWLNFFSGVGAAAVPVGLTATQAAEGATFGDGIGAALIAPPSLNLPLPTVFSTNAAVNKFSPNTVKGFVANALINIAEDTANGTPDTLYKTGVALSTLAPHTPLFGEGNALTEGVFLTQGADTPTTGFAQDANGTPLVPAGFTATTANQIFNALPFVTATGLGNNTLNIGDNLQTTGAAVGATKLVDIISTNTFAANPPFATNVTINGVNQVDITNAAGALPGGFQGKVTGLLIENNLNSVAPVTLGGTGQGLSTLLTDINISGYGGAAGDDLNTVILAAAIGAADKTINVSFTGGNLGTTADGGAQEIAISSDLAGGTKAAPNLTYGTWALTLNNNANLQLEQNVTTDGAGAVTAEGNVGGVGGATTLSLAGKGNIALSQDQIGEWRLLQTLNAGGESGTVIIPGATAGNDSNFLASDANPLWRFGGDFGFLDNTGTGDFALTEFDLGSGTNVLDVSTATAAQIAALKTVPNATPSTTNTIIVQDSVATTAVAATFANIKGFQTLGIGGPTVAEGAAGTIDMANLPASINNLTYITRANDAVTVNNGAATLTVNVNHNSPLNPPGTTPLAINRPAADTSLTDSLTVILGDTVGTVGGIIGANISFDPVGGGGSAIDGLSTQGYEAVNITSNGPAGQGNVLSGAALADVFNATPGGPEALTLQGDAPLFTNSLFVDGLGGTGVINDNLTSTLDIWAFGDNVNPSTPSGANFIATNAAAINGANSGGVFLGGSDLFFNGLTGDILTGSATKSNVLAGSNSNDTFTGGSGTDRIITDGGGDIIKLGAGHTGDHVELFFGDFVANGGGFDGSVAGTFANVFGLFESIVAAGAGGLGDAAVAGFWGVAPAVNADGTPAINPGELQPFDLFPHNSPTNNGTSADMSVVTGFVPGAAGDIVDFSVGAWSTVGNGNGLNGGNLSFGNLVPTNADANIITVSAGQLVPAAATVIELNQVFANANAVALALGDNIGSGGSTYDLIFAGAPNAAGGLQTHFLALYTDPTGSARIADVDVRGGSVNSILDEVVASDMVQLTGVAATTLVNHNIHFVT